MPKKKASKTKAVHDPSPKRAKPRAVRLISKPTKEQVNPFQKRRQGVRGSSEDRRSSSRQNNFESPAENESQYESTSDRSTMRIYLDQIEHIPLLTPDDEIVLARQVQAGGPEAEIARTRMINSNLRLVIAIAKRYSNMGLPFSDLVEEGNIGLMRAVEKFDPERGYRFSTYSSWWIKQGIMRSLSNQGKTIRIPVYMYDIIAKWRKVRDGLTQRLGRTPTRKEIAKMMEVPVDKIKEIEQIVDRPSSLNAPISIEGSAELIDLIEEDANKSPDAVLSQVLCSERVGDLLKILDEREQKILIARFGLSEGQRKTLEEVAVDFQITRERVRQIESASLKRIRKHLEESGDKLENYLSK